MQRVQLGLAGVTVVVAIAALVVIAPGAGAQGNETCLACHSAPGQTLTFPSRETVPITVDPQALPRSMHKGFACTTCHPRNAQIPHPTLTARTLRDFRAQVVSGSCRTCHPGPAAAWDTSIHGRAFRMGFADVPTCTSCHTAHSVVRATSPEFRNNIPQVCGTCHGNPAIARKYGLRPVYQAYIREFHGVTTTLYRLTKPYSPTPAAICYDCHGVHDIKAVDDPSSRVYPANLLGTCRTCHPTAGRFFTTAWTEHKTPSRSASPLVYYVQWFYRLLIPSVVGFLVMLTVLDLNRWAADRLGGGRHG